ncbi:hypothetical protein F441_20535 [Phytophthora nicotianae CJ01A1]|uniref:Uncharacterized protein n=1 Tax=Phytophthora nicotianae CJ01A1 TaxID=1317063 RepID=W2VW34_PHYNI|nr:hypothetical protein F441_20535 [Phytophthora nicotianae CJ01A1]
MESLYDALATAARKEGLRAFLPIGQVGKWICYGFVEADDSWALGKAQTTHNIDYMMRSEAEVMDPFICYSPRKSTLSTGPTQRHWEELNVLLSELKHKNEDGPICLKRLTLLQDQLSEQTRVMPDLEDEQSQQVELLTSIILEYVVSVTRLDMNVQKRFNLESNLGIIEPDTESDSDEEEDEYEQTSERQLELRRMETALAQVVVSMETANTHTSRGAMGIVANYSGYIYSAWWQMISKR